MIEAATGTAYSGAGSAGVLPTALLPAQTSFVSSESWVYPTIHRDRFPHLTTLPHNGGGVQPKPSGNTPIPADVLHSKDIDTPQYPPSA